MMQKRSRTLLLFKLKNGFGAVILRVTAFEVKNGLGKGVFKSMTVFDAKKGLKIVLVAKTIKNLQPPQKQLEVAVPFCSYGSPCIPHVLISMC